MAEHRFTPTIFHTTLGPHAPVLTIADGDTVITETLDAHGFDKHGKQPGRNPNPMTGPFFITGAEPGDALAVTVKRITMNRKTGWTRQGLAHHVVDPSFVSAMPAREKIDWVIGANGISLRAPPARLRDWSIAVEPMIGCFGVAPADGEAISTASSGPHGGNMDYRRFRPGVTAMFPVAVPGALFFLGDAHGAQGDGEIAGTGIETSAEIEFSVRVMKRASITWPRGEDGESIFTVGNARPLEQALQHATTEMLLWLESGYGLDRISAAHLMGMAVRYDVANVFNPAFSVACRIEKRWLAPFAA